MESCCTCAKLLSAVPRYDDGSSEKPLPSDRRLECCARVICGNCIHSNARFGTYCPYCQTSSSSSSSRLKDPPSYASSITSSSKSRQLLLDQAPPPPYTASPNDPLPLLLLDQPPPPPADPNSQPHPPSEKPVAAAAAAAAAEEEAEAEAEDTLHFLDPARDTIASLSLRYGVPAWALRRANRLHSDHLIQGRRTVVIPGAHYRGGVSLSPRPVEGEAAERRTRALRRWMARCKVADRDAAVLYLEQAGYDLEAAVERFRADEAWERAHPLEGAGGRRRGGGGGGGLVWNRGAR